MTMDICNLLIRRMSLWLFISALCWMPSLQQNECKDNNFFCKDWADRGLCNEQQEFMTENCPEACNFCRTNITTVLFPESSIAKPEFVCGLFSENARLSREKRQFDAIFQGISDVLGAGSRPPGSNGNQPSVPNFIGSNSNRRPIIPSFSGNNNNRPFIPNFTGNNNNNNRPPVPNLGGIFSGITQVFGTEVPSTFPSTNIVRPIISGIFNPTFGFETVTTETSTVFATATALPAPAPIPTPVGGGTNADTPSVGAVFVVATESFGLGRVTPLPITVAPVPAIVPRPSIVPTTSNDLPPRGGPITRPAPNPRPVPIPNPRPVPVPVTTAPTSRPTPEINPTSVLPSSPNPSSEATTDIDILDAGSETLEDAICGSAPITDRFLLSAAHCFANPNLRYRVRLGDLDLSVDGEANSQPQHLDIEKIHIHPSYNHSSGVRYNDIALLKTVQTIKFSSLVYPFCVLPRPKDFTGAPLTVAGFGFVNSTHRIPTLQAAVLRGLNDARCQARYIELGHEIPLRFRYPDLLIGKGIMCASTPDRSSCQGDSGGPLTLKDTRGRDYILGIVSTGASCLGSSLSILPGLYTDVSYHVDWIDSIIYGSP